MFFCKEMKEIVLLIVGDNEHGHWTAWEASDMHAGPADSAGRSWMMAARRCRCHGHIQGHGDGNIYAITVGDKLTKSKVSLTQQCYCWVQESPGPVDN
jgi:hypothetical protein